MTVHVQLSAAFTLLLNTDDILLMRARDVSWGLFDSLLALHHHASLKKQQKWFKKTSVFLMQKGAGYHLDLFWVAVLMVLCSFMGLPWYVAATVISIAHIDSLKMETETSAPGEQPKFLGVR